MYPDSSKTDAIQPISLKGPPAEACRPSDKPRLAAIIDNACRLRQILAAALPYWPARR